MRVRTVALLLLICLALLMSFPYESRGQGSSSVTIETKLVITDLNSIEGRGSVEFRFEGEAAVLLRYYVIDNFDENINQFVDPEEARNFLVSLADDLVGRQTWGVSIEDPTNYSTTAEDELVDMTEGLVYGILSSTGPISFGYDFHASGQSMTRELLISDTAASTYLDALRRVSGYQFEGDIHVRDRVVVFGLSSYTSPELANGKISAIRTPLGSVIWYSLDGEVSAASAMQADSLVYERFNIYENQQMAFVVLVIGCGLVLRMPSRRFDNYVLQHPKALRKKARPLTSVRAMSWGLVGLLVVLYVLPFVFSFAQPDLMLHSSYLYFIAPAAVLSSYIFSRVMYDAASVNIPEDTTVEIKQALVEPEKEAGELRCGACMMPIDAGLDLYECVCGFLMHMACAERSQACPQCGEVLFPEHTRSMECKACGETFLTSGEEDPFTLQCTRCGAFQEEIKPGVNYLVVDIDPSRGYNMLRSMGLSARPAMVLTSEFPGKIRDEYNLGEDFDVKWLTDAMGDIDSVNIKDLEGDAMETVSTFLMTTKRSGLLVDGLEAVISDNGFEAALAFVKRINDLAAIHGASVILWVDKTRLSDDQYKDVSDEFDEIHDYL